MLPRLGGLKVIDVRPSDIHSLHIAMQKAPYQANRTLALMSKMFSFAIRWDLRSDNPVSGNEKLQQKKMTSLALGGRIGPPFGCTG